MREDPLAPTHQHCIHSAAAVPPSPHLAPSCAAVPPSPHQTVLLLTVALLQLGAVLLDHLPAGAWGAGALGREVGVAACVAQKWFTSGFTWRTEIRLMPMTTTHAHDYNSHPRL